MQLVLCYSRQEKSSDTFWYLELYETEGNAVQGAQLLPCNPPCLSNQNELIVYCLQPIHTAVMELLSDCYKAFAS